MTLLKHCTELRSTLPCFLALAVLGTFTSLRAEEVNFSKPPAKPGSAEYNKWLDTAMSRLQRLSDEDALRKLTYSYGRGNDEISLRHADRTKSREPALAEYAKGFAPDVTVEVYALGGETPIGTTKGIPAWEEFVEKYFTSKKYSSSIHLMSNFSIDFVDGDTATVSCYAVVPHYILNPAKEKAAADTTVEMMNCRYTFNAKRQADGNWKTTKLKIELQEIWSGIGYFSGGQGKGL